MKTAVLAVILCGLVLGGCATTPVPAGGTGGELPDSTEPGTTTVPEETSQAGEPTTQERMPPPSTDSATLALLQQSERAAASGSIGDALAYAERAVRLEPRRADLWTRLAALELQNGDAGTAIQYANKALTLARDRVDWQRDAWLVIADAKELQGDLDGARAIRSDWQTYRG
jgi:predicted Zn-dependent protease